MPDPLTSCPSPVTPEWLTPDMLRGILRGIEREALRVNPDGTLATTPHPPALGSALTHPHITTDYSEALLELITPPLPTIPATLDFLQGLHHEVRRHLPPGEQLWPLSMPPVLGENDEDIPLANYGISGLGQFKTLYRKGLGLRYGRRMQTIAGVHYNLSFPQELFSAWYQAEHPDQSLPDATRLAEFTNARYLGLIRNFLRLSPLIIYLYGASPALDQTFLGNRLHHLEQTGTSTLFRPHATALRMGRLGYQNSAQRQLGIHYNSLPAYLEGLTRAVNTPFAEFSQIGTEDGQGNRLQINDHILQIENEYYSLVRPKQIATDGETPAEALKNRGIAYVELRAVDIDPTSPTGVSEAGAAFLELAALAALLLPARPLYYGEEDCLARTQATIIDNGREPGILLETAQGKVPFQAWASEKMQALLPLARLLDSAYGTTLYSSAWQTMQNRLSDPSQTLSARVLTQTGDSGGHVPYGLALAAEQAAVPLDNNAAEGLDEMALHSHARQYAREQTDHVSANDLQSQRHALDQQIEAYKARIAKM